MTKAFIGNFLVPSWFVADRKLIAGKIPRRLDDCSDPVGAKLYLALKARKRILDWKLGKRPESLAGRIWIWKRFHQEAFPLLGSFKTWFCPGDFHRVLSEHVKENCTVSNRLSEPKNVVVRGVKKAPGIDYNSWTKLSEYGINLSSSGGHLLIHGSQADGKVTPFSDIDLLMIGRVRHSEHMAIRAKIESLLLKCDPLQHHGVFFVERSDLECYWQLQLPVETLMQAATFGDDVVIRVRVAQEPYGSAASLSGLLRSWGSLLAKQSKIRGLWDWKYKLSQLMIIPTLLLAAGGLFVYKGESFSIARSLYSGNAWQAIEAATKIRANWPTTYSSDAYLSQPQRGFGRLKYDAAAVPEELALWKKKDFTNTVELFLKETHQIANL